jgi:hypothetical protein
VALLVEDGQPSQRGGRRHASALEDRRVGQVTRDREGPPLQVGACTRGQWPAEGRP